MLGSKDKDTICAVATPPGVGGISVIRLSGDNSLNLSRQLMGSLPQAPESHRAYFGRIKSTKAKQIIDEVLITYFSKGNSFTGEETCEISCHGSPIICERIIEELISLGARVADRGEFTYRSYMNGKIDLVQAESVLATIEAQSRRASELSVRNLTGTLSAELLNIENDILNSLALIETSIDFSTEDIEIINKDQFHLKLSGAKDRCTRLVATYQKGRLLTEGIQLVLSGLPNVGKSSLLNVFLQEERAIVTDIAGTTRDVISGSTGHGGLRFHFYDTAGIRESVDHIEKIGISKGLEAQRRADVVLFVFDCTRPLSSEEMGVLKEIPLEKLMLIGNKADLLGSTDSKAKESLVNFFSDFFGERKTTAKEFVRSNLFLVSALNKETRTEVLNNVVARFTLDESPNDVVINHSRQLEGLLRCQAALDKSLEMFLAGDGYEFIAVELKDSFLAVQGVLGKRFEDEIMDRVFSSFCIGK